ncbi:molybdopterin-synthase adenylyltransferase MoeB [Leptolinea tardivitalis]|uniref:Molybdenum cofactor biosynthesis protein MoeB n=1 Tax=Leptolinea tardivitalis TaxID=229920 RepID=A0A0P6X0W0_9CHLR|nr:molybdopterin-synthase adenylyltransferase MoeB [Leptolinea tardivitalis]KPL72909.1 molybdenum cofactor biosynthesis protein MoeB [Leptolinea tardivitalis]GAP20701.1 dinucleotide-utilizing enzymes [Leptolinea tardivitalis]
MSATFTQDEIYRYSRHLMIPEVGLDGQRKLKETSMLLVGAGGLGSPAAFYLAAAGVGRIGLVDDDVVDASNLQRQILHDTAHVGELKAESGKEKLLALNPYIEVNAISTCFNSESAAGIARDYDIILDCTDNFATRYLINDLCVLTGKPEVYGAIYRFEGQVSVFDSRRGPCYRCLFPTLPPPELSPSCSDAGVFGILPGVIGTMMATEAIKLALGIGSPLVGQLMIYDALETSFQRIAFPKQANCEVCGQTPSIKSLLDSTQSCGDATLFSLSPDERITPSDLAEALQKPVPPLLLDVRSPVEQQISSLENAVNIPLEQLSDRLDELDRQKEIVVFCRTGRRSARAVEILHSAGFPRVKNLTGGINAWVSQYQPGAFQY